MPDSEEIHQLMTTPPKLGRRERVERWVMRLCGVVSVAAFVLAMVAAVSGAATATCVNSNLGTRSKPSAADAKAHIEFARAVAALFSVQPGTPRAAQEQAVALFKAESQRYVTILTHDQAVREANPLGQC